MRYFFIVLMTSPLIFGFQLSNSYPEIRGIKIPKCSGERLSYAPHRGEFLPEMKPKNSDNVSESDSNYDNKNIKNQKSEIRLHDVPANEQSDLRRKFSEKSGFVDIEHITTEPSYFYYLEKPARNPKLINMIPINETAFKNVYKSYSYTQSNKNQVNNFVKSLRKFDEKTIENAENIEQLSFQIKESDGQPIVIFGHSKNKGKDIFLPDGNYVTAHDIHLHCRSLGKACLILTCNGLDFNISGRLVIKHAVKMFDASLEKIKKSDDLTIEDFRKEMITSRDKIQLSENISISILVSSGMGFGGYIITSSGYSDPKKKG